MRPEVILKMLREHPFEPLRIHLSDGVALCLIFALATSARAGVQVQLVPNPNLPLYPPGSVVQLDVKLAQTGGGSDQRLRLVEFDLQATSPTLLPGVSFPTTHNRGTPETGDDISFWYFGSLVTCASMPSECGLDHFIDSDLQAGPVDTRVHVLSMAYYALAASAAYQIVLKGDGTPVTVGKLRVTLPASYGIYTLGLINSGDTALNRGARVDFGFDPHFTWRARSAPPNDVSGGKLIFNVCDPNVCDSFCEPLMDGWVSVLPHSPNQPVPIPLIIPDTGLFSEPRGGIKKIVVTFKTPLDPATVIPANVNVCGFDLNNSVVDLSGVVVTTATTHSDTKMEINFNPSLPNFAKYRVALKNSILCSGGWPVQPGQGGLSRVMTALQGDAAGGGDRRVGATDLGAVRGLVGTNPIDPAILNHVRADVNNDGRINATDLGLVRSRVGQDARAILDPVCPP